MTSNLRPGADSTASTYSGPNLESRSLCSTATVATSGSPSNTNSFLQRPFSADLTSVTTRSTARLRPCCPGSYSCYLPFKVLALAGGRHAGVYDAHSPGRCGRGLVDEDQPADTGRGDREFSFPKPPVRGDWVHPICDSPLFQVHYRIVSLTMKQQLRALKRCRGSHRRDSRWIPCS